MICDYCNSSKLSKHYRSPSTKRDIDICICDECDLIQSWPRLSGIYKRSTQISGDADWGYIRYGKMLRLLKSMEFITKHIDINKVNSILDIGANRGSFLKYINENFKNPKILYGVENDKVIFEEELKNLDGITVDNKKFEDAKFEHKFDFIHSSHTLEHVTSPTKKLKKMRDLINENGLIYLEVPNSDCITIADNITEFFIDNHLYHFTKTSLESYIKTFGFEIVAREISDYYLCYILKPSSQTGKDKISKDQPKFAVKNIDKYKENLNQSRENIKIFKKNFSELSVKGKIALWGLGRIFDVIRKNNGFEESKIDLYIDKNLAKFMKNINGVDIAVPKKLKEFKIDNLVICSEYFFDEIQKEALNIDPDIRCIKYTELF